jgi:hypothetical protein
MIMVVAQTIFWSTENVFVLIKITTILPKFQNTFSVLALLNHTSDRPL